MSFQDSFNKLAKVESDFLESQFLSPVLKDHPIRVRIAGIVVTLQPNKSKKFAGEGWGVFKPTSHHKARYVREPSLAERQQYLELFPAVALILVRKVESCWYGILAGQDKRFKVEGLVPVALASEVQMFDCIVCRFDGNTFWFDSPSRNFTGTATYLRDQLAIPTEPEKVDIPGMTKFERDAYFVAFAGELENRRDKNEDRIKDALERAGAKYKSYLERADTFTVEFDVGGASHRSTVRKDDLSVVSAGICLSGHDREFDLQSLAGTIAQGQRERHIVRVGNDAGLSEERYRDMYGNGHDGDELY